MAKILEIKDDVVGIGEENGSLTEVRLEDLSFSPRIGDSVTIFRSENKIKVILKDSKNSSSGNSVSQNGQGININLSQNQVQQAPVQPAYVQAGKVVNKLTYVLLAFFLGGIGVHKFYSGKTGTGIFFLLFCWTGIPAIIALFDFICGLMKKEDSNGNIVV